MSYLLRPDECGQTPPAGVCICEEEDSSSDGPPGPGPGRRRTVGGGFRPGPGPGPDDHHHFHCSCQVKQDRGPASDSAEGGECGPWSQAVQGEISDGYPGGPAYENNPEEYDTLKEAKAACMQYVDCSGVSGYPGGPWEIRRGPHVDIDSDKISYFYAEKECGFAGPSFSPTPSPTPSPTDPRVKPLESFAPSLSPSMSPTPRPTTPRPSEDPTDPPTPSPTEARVKPLESFAPSLSPSASPTPRPTTPRPTEDPTPDPTRSPTERDFKPLESFAPSLTPTFSPSPRPTTPRPTEDPTESPTPEETPAPVEPTPAPTQSPTSIIHRCNADDLNTKGACNAEPGCSWIGGLPTDQWNTGVCVPEDGNCARYDHEHHCIHDPRCAWEPNDETRNHNGVCNFYDEHCLAAETPSDCEALVGCSWPVGGEECIVEDHLCTEKENQDDCLNDRACVWDGQNCDMKPNDQLEAMGRADKRAAKGKIHASKKAEEKAKRHAEKHAQRKEKRKDGKKLPGGFKTVNEFCQSLEEKKCNKDKRCQIRLPSKKECTPPKQRQLDRGALNPCVEGCYKAEKN